MPNYRRYQPYRQHYQQRNRRWSLIGWGAVVVALIILVRNGFGGTSRQQTNRSAGITLADNANQNGNVNAPLAAAAVEGRELTTSDCSRAISVAATNRQLVALTLDGGGIPGNALKVLDTAKQKQVPLTLFSTGKWAEDNAEVVKAFHDAGVDVFNHSYSHASFKGLATDKIDAELAKAEAAIQDVTLQSTKPYFRPPFGDVDQAGLAELRKQGYCTILWTADAYDWKDGATVDDAKARVLTALKAGAIILLQANSDIAADLVGPLVDEIRAKGYTFVTLRDLLRQPEGASNKNTNSNSNVNADRS